MTASADWQFAFVATNLLHLAYNAWSGFLAGERGAMVCSLSAPKLGMTGESFEVHYVPRSRLAPFLNAWLAAPDTVILNHHHINGHILQAVDGYNPETDAILLLESGDLASFLYLRNLPIAPPQGYEIVCQGWEEFHLNSTAFENMRLFQIDLPTLNRRPG
ncbi:MAG: hypothetical protein AAF609_19765 [Cyanobacteria bacterium P01_C01_bin.120]